MAQLLDEDVLAEYREMGLGWAMEPSHPASDVGAALLDVLDELETLRYERRQLIAGTDALLEEVNRLRTELVKAYSRPLGEE